VVITDRQKLEQLLMTKSIDKLMKISLQHFETIAENEIYYVNRRVGADMELRWKNGTCDRLLPTGQSSISIKVR